MSKTLDYGANSNNGNNEKHVRSHQSVTQQPRWFSGLRARISQLNMPEWLSQLGVRNFNYIASTEEVLPDDEAEKKVNCKDDQSKRRLDDVSKKLETCTDPEVNINGGDTIGSWLWEEADYEDTLALQHFGPLKNLITGCNHPGKGHDFLSLSVTHPTWCDKCGDFMWGFLTRAVKCDNNPRKFALYERVFHSSESPTVQNYSLTRISDESFPLKIVRSWEEKGEKRQLVLQENDTGDILWDMFEVPELENFLKILEDEEKQYSFRIRQKYDAYRWYLDENLRNRGFTVDSDEFSSVKANSCISTDV
ncbi:phorbol esters/diacylglycerol binding domain protein [Onchocerca flexuosa]|uniref:Phorbol esters/diacylglycerol binding domain protein n=1 Tax=Onchocerca flexuosa TaxID=387005 RepID=A0A238C0I9_9BILA|nr:phorbol esters/diacylglycerol binding domain protein [Onchocerca flexuosa]